MLNRSTSRSNAPTAQSSATHGQLKEVGASACRRRLTSQRLVKERVRSNVLAVCSNAREFSKKRCLAFRPRSDLCSHSCGATANKGTLEWNCQAVPRPLLRSCLGLRQMSRSLLRGSVRAPMVISTRTLPHNKRSWKRQRTIARRCPPNQLTLLRVRPYGFRIDKTCPRRKKYLLKKWQPSVESIKATLT